MKKHIPNFLTLMNLTAGFLAIMSFCQGDIIKSAWLLIIALIFDFSDGMAARLLNARSELGKQLDSLADVVSFGVAPALLMYSLINGGNGAEKYSNILIYTPVLIPVLSALRLGIFNLDESQTDSFKGLPTPANALFIIGLVLSSRYSESALIENLYSSRWILSFFTVCFSVLMVTRIPMFSFKIKNLRFKGNELRFIFIALSVVLAAGTGIIDALPLIIILYITVSVSRGLVR